MIGGPALLSALYKGEVCRLSRRFAHIPVAIPERSPSAGPAARRKDDDALFADVIPGEIVSMFVESATADFAGLFAGFAAVRSDKSAVHAWLASQADCEQIDWNMIRRMGLNGFKRRRAAPSLKVCLSASGQGRRIPSPRMARCRQRVHKSRAYFSSLCGILPHFTQEKSHE